MLEKTKSVKASFRSTSLIEIENPELKADLDAIEVARNIPSEHRLKATINTIKADEGGVISVNIETEKPPQNFEQTRRGEVYGHSSSSCLRMLKTLQNLDIKKLTNNYKVKPHFLTLTYAKDYPDCQKAKKHLQILLRRFEKRYPKFSCVWKLELQKRGAPHFHILTFGVPTIQPEALKNAWGDIIDAQYWDYSRNFHGEIPFTDAQPARNIRKTLFYIGKYMSKTDVDTGFISVAYLTQQAVKNHKELFFNVIHRAIANEPVAPNLNVTHSRKENLEKCAELFKKYATKEEFDILCPPMGRCWGLRGKANMPFVSPKLKKVIITVDALTKLKNLSKCFRNFTIRADEKGFCVFIDSEDEFLKFEELLNHFLENGCLDISKTEQLEDDLV